MAHASAVSLTFFGLRHHKTDDFAVLFHLIADVFHELVVLFLHQQLVLREHVQQHQDRRRQADVERLVLAVSNQTLPAWYDQYQLR